MDTACYNLIGKVGKLRSMYGKYTDAGVKPSKQLIHIAHVMNFCWGANDTYFTFTRSVCGCRANLMLLIYYKSVIHRWDPSSSSEKVNAKVEMCWSDLQPFGHA